MTLCFYISREAGYLKHSDRGQATRADQFKEPAHYVACRRMYWDALQMAQQEIDRLWGKLERVEQDIQASKQELREVTKAMELPEIIAVIRKRKDRLVENKKDMRQLLNALQTQLIGPASEVLAAAS